MDAGPSGFKTSIINMLKALWKKERRQYAMTWVTSARDRNYKKSQKQMLEFKTQ